MDVGDNGSGGAGDGSGGTGDNPNKKDPVAYDSYQKILDEKKAQSARLKAAEEKLAQLEKEQKEREDAKLKEQGKYKEALTAKEQELAAQKAKHEELQKQITDGRKLSAFLDSVEGGVDRRYWNLIDLDLIEIGDDGMPSEDSVKKAADAFKESYPEVVKKKAAAEPPNNHGTPPGAGKISYNDWTKLPAKEMRERRKDVDPKTVPQ